MDVNQVAGVLIDQVVQTPQATPLANEALAALRRVVDEKLRNLMRWHFKSEESRAAWNGVLIPNSETPTPLGAFQIHVIKWKDVRQRNYRRPLEYLDDVGKKDDSSGLLSSPPSSGKRTIWHRNDRALDKLVVDYFHELFCAKDAPLAVLSKLFDYIEESCHTHRVVLSADFYVSRHPSQKGLHKDTTGTTLFVGLHYHNPKPMLGPEYIHDFLSQKIKDPKERVHAPWSKDGTHQVFYWPEALAQALEVARDKLWSMHEEDQDLLRATVMPAHGLITFVDELVFHATPLPGHRNEYERKMLFKYASIPSCLKRITLPQQLKVQLQNPPRLRRQMSDKEMTGDLTGGGEKRSFVRFWAMVEPKGWHRRRED